MDFELQEDFVKEHGFNEDQTSALKAHVSSHIAELQQQWDGKANENAEGILNGALSLIAKQTGVNRNDGEKAGEYIPRAWENFSQDKTQEIDRLKSEYNQKLQDFNGDTASKAELEKARLELDEAKQKYADYDSLKETAEKYNPLAEKYEQMNVEVCFSNVKPSFPDTVNQYEANFKWNEFKNEIQQNYNIKLVDGVAKAIDKENEYKVFDLKDLVSKNDEILELSKGRQQSGINHRQGETVKIEGVPFDVPKDADSKTRTKLIQEHLAKEGISTMHKDYSAKFAELNQKILTQKTV